MLLKCRKTNYFGFIVDKQLSFFKNEFVLNFKFHNNIDVQLNCIYLWINVGNSWINWFSTHVNI